MQNLYLLIREQTKKQRSVSFKEMKSTESDLEEAVRQNRLLTSQTEILEENLASQKERTVNLEVELSREKRVFEKRQRESEESAEGLKREISKLAERIQGLSRLESRFETMEKENQEKEGEIQKLRTQVGYLESENSKKKRLLRKGEEDLEGERRRGGEQEEDLAQMAEEKKKWRLERDQTREVRRKEKSKLGSVEREVEVVKDLLAEQEGRIY